MSRPETEVLSELVAQKLDALAQLHALGERQLELASAGDLTQLLRLLSGKQRMLARLQRLEDQLVPFRRQDPESRAWRCSEDRQRCARMVELCSTLLHQIVEQEKRSEGELVRRRDEAATQLAGMHRSHRAQQAYQADDTLDRSVSNFTVES